jgi:ubiquinone/menaquinone biosynthesis C-methylase UbiE
MAEINLKEMFKKTFDTVAKGYDNPAMRFFTESVPPLASYLNLAGDERILDVATGTGNTALGLAGHVPQGQVYGIDFSSGMLAKAGEKRAGLGVDNVTFIEMDMQAIEFPNDHFDLAVCSFGIFFVEDMVGQLVHMADKVRHGGRIVTTSFSQNMFSPQGDLFLDRIEQYGVEIPPMTWKRTNSRSKCRALFEDAGLAQVITLQEDVGYFLPQVEQWWDILWNAGYRGLITQLSEIDLARFKKEHLAEVAAFDDGQGLWLDINVIYTIGTKTK